MEPVTHILTGTCLARAGLNRHAAYTTAAMAIAAELPDIDTLWSLRGPVYGFQHHRGITHTVVGIPVEAGILLAAFWHYHRWHTRRAHPKSQPKQGRTPGAPVRWTALYSFIVVALLSHILLDYTNNYGIRPFFPFDAHWYAASIVFIFDPLLFVFLLAGLLLPSLFALIGEEVGSRQRSFRGAGWARAALLAIVVLWLVRTYEHNAAVSLANGQTLEAPAEQSAAGNPSADGNTSQDEPPEIHRQRLMPLKVLASPDPLSIFRWYTATDFGPAYQLGTVNTHAGTLAATETLDKPARGPFLQAAERSHLGQVYLDWSAMPWISSDDAVTQGPGNPDVTVLFQDLRFMGTIPLLRLGGSVPLTGTVVLGRGKQVLEQGIDGRFQH